jgi:preprotein translocase subunit SecD
MNRYPAWKNVVVILAAIIGITYALPNVFGEDPALQISLETTQPLDQDAVPRVEGILQQAAIPHSAATLEEGRVTARFNDVESQLQAVDRLREDLGSNYVVALTLAPRTPEFMRALGLEPMSLGLDLRGGVHFLYQVDMDAAIDQTLQRYETDFRSILREERIRSTVRQDGRQVIVELRNAEDLEQAQTLLTDADPDLNIEAEESGGTAFLRVRLSEEQIRQRQDFAIQQNTVTLRNRVNELGVAEPVVQRQGLDRIVVQLPGVQDPAQAERVLGATATLEFRLVDENNNPFEAERRGRAPLGSELFKRRDGTPVLLKRDVIVRGEQLVDATAGFSEDGLPAVHVQLDAKGARRMGETTRQNLNKGMAVLFVEQKREFTERDGEQIETTRVEKEVISVATIRGVFSSRFQITGLDPAEAQDLALLLRAGSLAAPIYKVEERTIGPSLGKANIDRGMMAILIGFVAVVIFMGVYYRVFGLVANLALLANLVFIVALLSMLQASLTLPGIAGIVLTTGMAVDANVLIFERIREELRNGNSPQASIQAGYEKALSSIADANITTLIAAAMLFIFGTGPIQGFAVTLSLGIMTSMFTAIMGTRAVINLIYGGRRLQTLAI